jgi:hypothetical protein
MRRFSSLSRWILAGRFTNIDGGLNGGTQAVSDQFRRVLATGWFPIAIQTCHKNPRYAALYESPG